MDQYLDSHISDVQSHFLAGFFASKENSKTEHCIAGLQKVYRGVVVWGAGPRGVPKKEGEATLHHENGLSELYVCVCIHCLFPINYFCKTWFSL